MNESGPCVLDSSLTSPRVPEPDSGRSRATGRTSAGRPIASVSGESARTARSSAPEARSIEMATRIATRNGMMRTAVSKPSLAPSTKLS